MADCKAEFLSCSEEVFRVGEDLGGVFEEGESSGVSVESYFKDRVVCVSRVSNTLLSSFDIHISIIFIAP